MTISKIDDRLDDELRWLKEENVVEVISKRKESINTASGIVSLITRDEIDRYNATDLHELLSRVTSIYTAGSYAWQFNTTSIRGDLATHANTHVLVLMNGRPMRDNYFGGLNGTIYHHFPIHAIERVEVVRGPGSVLYGTNAYAGVINIITQKNDPNGITLRGRYGSYTTGQVESEFAYKKNALSTSGAVRYKNSSGWLFSVKGEDGKQTQFRDDDDAISASFTAEWEGLTLNSFLARSQNNHYGAVTAGLGRGQVIEEKKAFVDLGYSKQFNSNWRSQINFTYNYTAQNFPLPNPGPYNASLYKGRENAFLLEETNFLNFFDNSLNILFGGIVEWQAVRTFQVASAPPVAPTNQFKASLYGEVSYKLLDNLKLNAGGQWSELHYLKGANIAKISSKSISDKIGRLGLVYEFNENFGAKLLYSQAFRFAVAAETGAAAAGTVYGDPALKPERVETIDAQVFYTSKNYQASLTAFRTRQSNLIGRALCGTNPICEGNSRTLIYASSGSAKFKGIEFESKLKPIDGLQLQGSYTFQTNWNKQDNNVSVAPQHMFKVGGSYDITPDLQLGVFDTYFSKPLSIGTLNPNVKIYNPVPNSYHNLSINAHYKLNHLLELNPHKKAAFSLYLDNALDEKLYYPEFNRKAINSIPGLPGRMLFGELSIEF